MLPKNDPGRLSFFSVGGDAHEVHREMRAATVLWSRWAGAKGADVCVLCAENKARLRGGELMDLSEHCTIPQLSKNGALLSVSATTRRASS